MSSTPTIPPSADPAITSIPGAAPNGPVPVPGVPLPAFDNTLGALYIGSTLSMLLYGIICLQMFIYITSTRTKKDSHTANQATLTASVYKFLVSDYLNPFALPSGGAGSGEIFTYAHSIIGTSGILFIQLSGVKRTDHVITLLIMFTVNTNLLTTFFIALPKATVYGGLGFLSAKLYFNTLLASLNSREYMRNELIPADSVISSSQLATSTGTKGLGTYSSASSFPGSGPVKKLLRVDESMTFVSSKQSEGDTGSYEMAPQPPIKQPELVLPSPYIQLSLSPPRAKEPQCPQPPPIVPSKSFELWTDIGLVIRSDAYRLRAVEWLSQAVKIPTETYDDMGPVGGDDRWDAFGPFHDYLRAAFPLVHSNLELTAVNTYGIVFVWNGSDDTKKPLLLAGHQDVVPVDLATVDDWVHPPYSGYYDGQRIWGRGASDDKNGLISILASVETLLEASFEPTRTIVLAFGFDEESSGEEGARKLGVELERRYGKGGFSMIVDEGDGFGEKFGTTFAIPAIAEKGYLDVKIEVTTPGGHSSLPPAHTSIGILAALLVELENKPHPMRLERRSPVFLTLQCLADHAEELPVSLRDSIKHASHSEEALLDLERQLAADKLYSSLIGTTQSVTMIEGGVKANALPEHAWALINHRISTESSVEETIVYDADTLRLLAKAFNLTYITFGADATEQGTGSSGTLILSDAWSTALEPAPVTPIDQEPSPYALLAGTIKATYKFHRNLTGGNIAVSPGILAGNTDTQSYWKLSECIFRYNHQDSSNGDMAGLHTVNEYITVDGYMEMIQFFVTLILNMDESTLP
ncbi:hypothetical protein EYR38_002287 [Pleurotus pulmonarius]|nr:hypothetical protein EYR38_002287 [Pleurotus pulmonarius]